MSDEQSKEANESHREAHGSLVAIIARVLSERALSASYAVLAFILACWSMYSPNILRAEVAGGFCVFVLILALVGRNR